MKMTSYLKSYRLKHVLSAALAVFIAVIVNDAAWTKTGWVVLAAFLVSQVTYGTPFRQGAIFFITMIVSIIAAFFLKIVVGGLGSVFVAAVLFMAGSYFSFIYQPLQNKALFYFMLPAFVLLMAVFVPTDSLQLLQDEVVEVGMGAGIGVLCGLMVLRIRFYKEFRRGLIPVLQASLDYLHAVTAYFIRRENDLNMLAKKRIAMEQSLQIQHGVYPEWVYAVGFNPGLRASFRFYLLNVERMVEILLSMDYFAAQGMEMERILKIVDTIYSSTQKNAELMEILIEYFANNKLKDITADFTSDISALDAAANRLMPGHLELLDISPDYITLASFVRDIKDLRRLLLQLVMALPASH